MRKQVIKDNKKRCSKCRRWILLEDFSKEKMTTTGYRSYCKVCQSKMAQKWLKKNRERSNKNSEAFYQVNKLKIKTLNQELRKKVLSHYGGVPPRCKKCNYDIYQALDLDHVNDDGRKERRIFRGSLVFYKYIIKNNYPQKYQVLCKNCNWLKFYEK